MTYPIAHRGLSERHRENSLAAIDASLDFVPVVEFDVRATNDAVPVCAHDLDLERSHGLPHNVGRVAFAHLRAHVPDVPTLAEALDLVADRGGAAMLDVKVTRPRAMEAIERVVAASRMTWNDGRQLRTGEPLEPGTLTFQSANPQLLQALRSRTGAGCLELIGRSSSPREIGTGAPLITMYAQGVTVPDALSSRAILRLLRRLRLGTYVYTVNDQQRYEELAAHGASGVYTDAVDRVGRA